MTIGERFRKEIGCYLLRGLITAVPAESNWLTLDSRGRIEAWQHRPFDFDAFQQWQGHRMEQPCELGFIPETEKHYNLLVSQWKSCIIAINEIEEKPSHDAPLSGLIAVAAMLDHHPDAWL